MVDLLALSARIIDEGTAEGAGPLNRITGELTELTDGLAIVESFSHVWALRTDDGLFVSDTCTAALAPAAFRALRGWSTEPINTVLYTHGHVDHVGGGQTVLDDASAQGHPKPTFIGHAAIPERFDRYDLTNGYNAVINARQFGGRRRMAIGAAGGGFQREWVRPDDTYETDHRLHVGGAVIELHHAKGETDDHTWAWLPERRAILCGDLIIWNFPNAGNPQKVQRFPREWAEALRRMIALEPELLLPAHGLPIAGQERIALVLGNTARALEHLVTETLAMMNEGARLDDIIRSVQVPDDLARLPYLLPNYDEPEFVVRNIWRLYGGWYDGNPARLKPAPDSAIGAEVAALAGGAESLAARAGELSASDAAVAVQLAEWAVQAEPANKNAHAARAAAYRVLREQATSLMARGIYGAAAAESDEATGGGG